TAASAKRIICIAIVLVALLLLPLSANAAQSRGGDRDLCKGSNDAADCAKSLEARKALAATRRAAKAKFKFHKLERMDDDDDEDEDDGDGDDEAANGGGEEENNTEELLNRQQAPQRGERNSADNDDDEVNDGGEEEDDDDDDDDDDDGDDGDGDGDNDDEDDGENNDEDEANDGDDDDDDNEEEDDNDGEEDDEEPSLFSRLLATFASDEAPAKRAPPQDSESQLPNIISWFNWLTEQATDTAPPAGKRKDKDKDKAKAAKSADVDWLTYLKRWPFNSIFPQTPEPPAATARSKTKQQQAERGERQRATGKEASARRAQGEQQGRSQEEYMELLIHSLPAFIGNVAQVKSGECHQQLELLHQKLRAHKLWTLQMLDATGKIGAGLLRGNINQLGDFEQCTQLATAVKQPPAKPVRIYGKYCLAQIELRATSGELKDALHLLHGRGLWHAHLKNVSHTRAQTCHTPVSTVFCLPMQPKHFVARYSVANWGVCVPHACSAHVVHSIIETSLRPYNDTGLQFHVDVRDEHCTVQRKRRSFSKLLARDNNFAMGIFGLSALAAACLLSSVWQHWDWLSGKLARLSASNAEEAKTDAEERTEQLEETQEEQEEAPPTPPALHLRLLHAFSPQRTWQALISLEGEDTEFPLVHLLRVLATLLLYAHLKFIMAGHLPITNRDAFVGSVNRLWSVGYRLPLLYSDLLLLLSGFLVAHQLAHQMETTCRLGFVRNVATKAVRYVPSVLAVLGFQTWLLPHLGAGPLWQLLVGENARLCEENMWRSALSVQNTADMEDMCSPLTVQLSLDLQLYFLGALVVWLYFTDPEAGFFLCGAFHAMSVAARFSRTQREHLAPSMFHGIHVSKFYRTANMIYTSPITRASAYLLGIGAALLFRSESGSFRMPARFRRAGWAVATLAVGWCFWSPAAGLWSKYVYKSADAAAYLAWSPLILGLGVGWAILMAPLDKSLVQRFPHVARAMLLLSRLEVPLQLASYVVVLWTTASVKEPHQFLMSDLVSCLYRLLLAQLLSLAPLALQINLQELVCIVLFALAVAFLVDFPAREIGLLILDFNFSDPLLSQSKDKDDAGDETAAEEVKSDSPEPSDSIWPSESDPEDEKPSE
ncbi:hypothetical protein KR093_008506, partial [Drosophila rubida]